MTEQQAKHSRKLDQAVLDAIKAIPERYTLDDLEVDLMRLRIRMNDNGPGVRKLSTKMIAGILRFQVDNL